MAHWLRLRPLHVAQDLNSIVGLGVILGQLGLGVIISSLCVAGIDLDSIVGLGLRLFIISVSSAGVVDVRSRLRRLRPVVIGVVVELLLEPWLSAYNITW